MRTLFLILFFVFAVLGNCQPLHAQLATSDSTYREIMRADSLLFDVAFNNCQLDVLYSLTDADFEFYHDQSGIQQSQEEFIDAIRKNICSIDYRPKRELQEGSSKLYPLYDNGILYGILQQGVHAFYAVEEDKAPYLTSTAKFTHLWIKKDERWVLRRVLSYDHQTPREAEILPGFLGNREAVESWLKENKVPALGVALLRDYQLKGVAVYGNLYDDVAAPKNTLFNVASLTKPIVTMLTLKLVDAGEWKLDEPLAGYWVDPDVADDPNSRKITTRHILSHQSGFRNWRAYEPDQKLRFNFEPGTDFQYSGEGFEYLKHALENKFQQPLEVLADSLIFSPLHMNDTHFFWDDSVAEARFARWHDAAGENSYPDHKIQSVSAADNLISTVEDYGRFSEYMLQKGGLSDALYQEMIRQQNGTKNQVKIGLGWEILPALKEEEYALLHSGSDVGVNTLIILLPETGEGLVIFTNSDNGRNLYFKLIQEYLSLGKQITAQAQ